jgi:hypothetical protein
MVRHDQLPHSFVTISLLHQWLLSTQQSCVEGLHESHPDALSASVWLTEHIRSRTSRHVGSMPKIERGGLCQDRGHVSSSSTVFCSLRLGPHRPSSFPIRHTEVATARVSATSALSQARYAHLMSDDGLWASTSSRSALARSRQRPSFIST